jgi:hypothetical protein
MKNRQFRLARAALKAIITIVTFNNPYCKGSKKNIKNVCPDLN